MLRFDNNTDSNQHSGAYFYWTVLTQDLLDFDKTWRQ